MHLINYQNESGKLFLNCIPKEHFEIAVLLWEQVSNEFVTINYPFVHAKMGSCSYYFHWKVELIDCSQTPPSQVCQSSTFHLSTLKKLHVWVWNGWLESDGILILSINSQQLNWWFITLKDTDPAQKLEIL